MLRNPLPRISSNYIEKTKKTVLSRFAAKAWAKFADSQKAFHTSGGRILNGQNQRLSKDFRLDLLVIVAIVTNLKNVIIRTIILKRKSLSDELEFNYPRDKYESLFVVDCCSILGCDLIGSQLLHHR